MQNFLPLNSALKLFYAALTSLLCLFNLNSQASNYYWVGGSGNWSDYATHWAIASGGLIFHIQTPGPNDNVLFDANSFPTTGDTVTADTTFLYCKNMDWTGALNTPTLTRGNFNIYGSLTLISNMNMPGLFNYGNFNFLSTTTGNTITCSGNNIGDVGFSGVGGSWSMSDDLNCKNFSVSNGTFNTNSFAIDCEGMIPNYSSTLLLNTSVVSASYVNFMFATTVDADSADFILNGSLQCGNISAFHNITFGNGGTIDANIASFNNVIFSGYGSISSNQASFNKVVFFDGASISGTNVIDTLLFNNPGKTIMLNSIGVLTVNGLLSTNPLPGFPIFMHSNGGGSQATISKPSGTVCFNYFLMQDINATGGAQFFAGDYSTNLGNNTGWSFTSCAPAISDVWPGDANYDLIANNMDILNIGVAYNDTGYVRPSASINWVAQPALDWLSQFITGVNAKHADCDGNGIVNVLDTIAVSQNYGLIHPHIVNPDTTSVLSGASLYFDLPAGNLPPGTNASVPINFGTVSTPATNLYGMAFTVNYNPALIQAGSMYVDYTGSWMATPSTYIHLEKDFPANGKIDMAACRINHQNVSGSGLIATLHFTVAANATGFLNLSFSNVKAISNNELQLAVNAQNGSVFTSIDDVSANTDFIFYPNPVHDYLYLDVKNHNIKSFEIIDAIGQRVLTTNAAVVGIDLKNFANGMYLLRGISAKSEPLFEQRFVKE